MSVVNYTSDSILESILEFEASHALPSILKEPPNGLSLFRITPASKWSTTSYTLAGPWSVPPCSAATSLCTLRFVPGALRYSKDFI